MLLSNFNKIEQTKEHIARATEIENYINELLSLKSLANDAIEGKDLTDMLNGIDARVNILNKIVQNLLIVISKHSKTT